ncbi:class I SAM-dependent methyltransferase [Haladaptatus sp. DYF46]|uniref:class I SAM-dependent methyltransferase n=1 Tax=Haladaptatus sp. DYF46 TaxID=2886041 RepID=UPI001E3E464F|nr:class I SAM-dependent methyltransferase [Haladaptatus sp. DYF46]
MDPNSVRQQWEERSGEYSPDYYAYYGPDETSELLRARLDSAVASDASVLELGCSSGRHLARLHEAGYEDLHGIEINDEALSVMEETYPDLAEAGTFHIDAIEETVPEFDDGQFDVVFSVETLQHLHPDDEWVFDEVARITGERLITVENEVSDESESGETDESDGSEPDVNYVRDEFPLYYRNWNRIFTERGFAEIDSETLDRDTFRVFRPVESADAADSASQS